MGVIYPNGSLRIVDRAKNIFKLSQGEYISPEKVEAVLKLHPAVADCFITGESTEDCAVGIVCLGDGVAADDWAKKTGVPEHSKDEKKFR